MRSVVDRRPNIVADAKMLPQVGPCHLRRFAATCPSDTQLPAAPLALTPTIHTMPPPSSLMVWRNIASFHMHISTDATTEQAESPAEAGRVAFAQDAREGHGTCQDAPAGNGTTTRGSSTLIQTMNMPIGAMVVVTLAYSAHLPCKPSLPSLVDKQGRISQDQS